MAKTILLTGSALMVLAVSIGAFGAHILKEKLAEDMMQIFKTGVEYHFYHALGLLLVGFISMRMPSVLINWSAILLFVGVILFCGSLYVLSVTGLKWLGAITPLGGLSFIAGWVLLFIAVLKSSL